MEILKLGRENFREMGDEDESSSLPLAIARVIDKAVEYIKEGRVLVLPTDTVYGLTADATNKKAVEKIVKIKERVEKKPLSKFIKDIKEAKKFAIINKRQERFLKRVWPGKVTVVLKKKKGKRIYDVGKRTIGFRIPDYKLINTLLKKIDRPLIGTSANISGKPASTKIKEIIRQFRNKKYQPDLIIDAGNLAKSRPSKVIDITGKKIKILRK
jgi:L-threonylcarbamoyladenylate synthase